ncbi:MAG: hypothetical protein RL274_1163 [Pseudomonadota bacterium]|jgi:hypothetical protein
MRRVFLISGLMALAALPALAEPTRDEVMAGAERCDGIADNRVWLDCFYGSAQPMRSVLNLPPANPAQVRLVPPPGAEPRRIPATAALRARQSERSGGFWSDVVGSTRPEASNIAMTKYEFDRSGAFTVTLADGQVWRQLESDLVRARWNKPASTYRVTVASGLGDTFDLKVNGEKVTIYRMRRMTARR